MKTLRDQIQGQHIKQVIYSEVNDHQGPLFHQGFDCFDYGINICMKNDFWWHIAFKSHEYFELGEGRFYHNDYLDSGDLIMVDATSRWQSWIPHVVKDLQVDWTNKELNIPGSCEIQFYGIGPVTLRIGPELEPDGSLPHPFPHEIGEIYVFFEQEIVRGLNIWNN
ncbi:MAG: hypothetical protein AAFV07_14590 [Bacteroidota bacterium]